MHWANRFLNIGRKNDNGISAADNSGHLVNDVHKDVKIKKLGDNGGRSISMVTDEDANDNQRYLSEQGDNVGGSVVNYVGDEQSSRSREESTKSGSSSFNNGNQGRNLKTNFDEMVNNAGLTNNFNNDVTNSLGM